MLRVPNQYGSPIQNVDSPLALNYLLFSSSFFSSSDDPLIRLFTWKSMGKPFNELRVSYPPIMMFMKMMMNDDGDLKPDVMWRREREGCSVFTSCCIIILSRFSYWSSSHHFVFFHSIFNQSEIIELSWKNREGKMRWVEGKLNEMVKLYSVSFSHVDTRS